MAKRKEFSTKGMNAFSNTISAIDSSNFKYTYFVYDETEYARLVLKGAAGDRVFIDGNVGDFNARVVGKTLYLSSTLGKQDIVISLSSATKTKAAKTTLYFLDGAYSFGGKTGKMSLGGKRLNSTEKDLGDLLKPTTNKTGAIYFGSESVFYSTESLSNSTDLLKTGTRDDLIIGNNATFNSEDRIDAGLGGKDKLTLDLAAQGGSILAGYVSNVEHLDLTAKENRSYGVVLDMERFDDQLQQINILNARANVKLLDQQSIADVFIQDTDKDIELDYDSQVVNGKEDKEDVLNVTIDEFGHGAQSELTIDTGIETLNIDVRDGDYEASNIALTAAGVEKLVVTRGRDAQDFTLNADVEAGADFNSAAFVGNMDLTSSDIKTATFGAGDDTALIDGQANLSDSSYDLGEGDNEITIGRIADAIPPTTVGGSDGVPADTIGLALGGQILAGNGDNQVIVNGDLLATGSIALGNGDNFVSVRGGGTAGNGMVLGTVAAGNGDNTVTVTGDVAGESSITLGALGDGDNTLDVGGDIKDDATVQLGNGDNRVTVLGDIQDDASVTLGDGANALTVGANIDGKAAVAFGNGDNVAKVVGVVTDDTQVEFGDGDNLMEVAGSVGNSDSTYLAGIAFGDGDNTLTVGGAVDTQSITLTKVVAATQMTFQFSTESGAVYRVAYDATGSFNPGTDQASRITFSKQATNGTFTTIPLPLTGQHAVEAAIAAEIGALNITFFDEPTDFMTIWAGVDYPKITSAVQINTATGSAYADSQATVTRVNGQFVDLGSTDSDGNVENATITFGDGTNFMQVDDDVISSSITFGDGISNKLIVGGNVLAAAPGTITFGGGANNSLDIGGSLIGDAVVFGNGAGNSFAIGEDVTNAASITLGNGGSSGSVDGVVNEGSTITFGSAADQLTIGDFSTASPLVYGSGTVIQNVQISYDLTPDTATVIRMGGDDDHVTLQSAGAGYVVSGGVSSMTPAPQGFLVESGGFIHGEGGSDDTFTVVTQQADNTNVIGRTQDQKVEIELFKPDTESYQAGDIITISFSDGATALAPISYTVVDADIVQGNGVQTSANIADKVAAALNASLPFQAVFTAEAIDGTASTSPTGMTAVYLTSKNPHQDFTIESSHGTVTVMQISDARVTGFENVELVVENVATSGDGTTVQANFDLINGAQNILLDSQVQRIATVETFTSAGTDVDGPESLTNGAYTEYTPGGLTTFDLDNLQGGEKITVRGHETGAEGSCSDPDTGTGNQQVNRINVDARVDAHKIGDKITVEIGEVTMVYTVVAEDLVDGQTETVDADRIAAKLRDMINAKTAEHGFTAVVDTRATVEEVTDEGYSEQSFVGYTPAYNDGAWVTLTGALDLPAATVTVAHTRTLVQTTAQASDSITVDGDVPTATQASWNIAGALGHQTNKLLPGDVITVIRAASEGVPYGTASYKVTAEDCLRLNADKIAAALAEQLGGTAEANWGVVSFGGLASLVITRTTEPAVANSQTALSGTDPLQTMTSTDDGIADVIIDATLAEGAENTTMDLTVDGYGAFDLEFIANSDDDGYTDLEMTLADDFSHTINTNGQVWKLTQTVASTGVKVTGTGATAQWVIDLTTEAGDVYRVSKTGGDTYTLAKNGSNVTISGSGTALENLGGTLATQLNADTVTVTAAGAVTVVVEQASGNPGFSKIESVVSRNVTNTNADTSPTNLTVSNTGPVGNFSNSITIADDAAASTAGQEIVLQNVLAREVVTSNSAADFTINQYTARKDSTGVFSGETITVTTGTGDDHLTTLAQSALETGSSINLGTGSNTLSLGWGGDATLDSADLEDVGDINYSGDLSQLDILNNVVLDQDSTTLTMPGTDPMEKVTFTDVEAAVTTKQTITLTTVVPSTAAGSQGDMVFEMVNGEATYRVFFDQSQLNAQTRVTLSKKPVGAEAFTAVALDTSSGGKFFAALAAELGAVKVVFNDQNTDILTIWGDQGYSAFTSVKQVDPSTFVQVPNSVVTIANTANALIGGDLTIAGTANTLSIESADDFDLTALGSPDGLSSLVNNASIGTLTATNEAGEQITGNLSVTAGDVVKFAVGNDQLDSLTVTSEGEQLVAIVDGDERELDIGILSMTVTGNNTLPFRDPATLLIDGNDGSKITIGKLSVLTSGETTFFGDDHARVQVSNNTGESEVSLGVVGGIEITADNLRADASLDIVANDSLTFVGGAVTLKAVDDASMTVDGNSDSSVTIAGDITIEGKGDWGPSYPAALTAALSVDDNTRTNVSLADGGTIDLVACGFNDDAVVSVSGNVNDYDPFEVGGPDSGSLISRSYAITLGDVVLNAGDDTTLDIQGNSDDTYWGDLSITVGNVDMFAYDNAALNVGGTAGEDGNFATTIDIGTVDMRVQDNGSVVIGDNDGRMYPNSFATPPRQEPDFADISIGKVTIDADEQAYMGIGENNIARIDVDGVSLTGDTGAGIEIVYNGDSSDGVLSVPAQAPLPSVVVDLGDVEVTATTGLAGVTIGMAYTDNFGEDGYSDGGNVDTHVIIGELEITAEGSDGAAEANLIIANNAGTAGKGLVDIEKVTTSSGLSTNMFVYNNSLIGAAALLNDLVIGEVGMTGDKNANLSIFGNEGSDSSADMKMEFGNVTLTADNDGTAGGNAQFEFGSNDSGSPNTANDDVDATFGTVELTGSDAKFLVKGNTDSSATFGNVTMNGDGSDAVIDLKIIGNSDSSIELGAIDIDSSDDAFMTIGGNGDSFIKTGNVDIDADNTAYFDISGNVSDSVVEVAVTRATSGANEGAVTNRGSITIDAAGVGAYFPFGASTNYSTYGGFVVGGNSDSDVYLGNVEITAKSTTAPLFADIVARISTGGGEDSIVDFGDFEGTAGGDVYVDLDGLTGEDSTLNMGDITLTSGDYVPAVTGEDTPKWSSDLFFRAVSLNGNNDNDSTANNNTTGAGVDNGQQITLTAKSVGGDDKGNVYAHINRAPDLNLLTVSGTNAEIYLEGQIGENGSANSLGGSFTLDLSGMTGTFDTITTYNPLGDSAARNSTQDDGTYVVTVGATFDNDLRDVVIKIGEGDLVYNAQHSAFTGSSSHLVDSTANYSDDWFEEEGWFSLGTGLDLVPESRVLIFTVPSVGLSDGQSGSWDFDIVVNGISYDMTYSASDVALSSDFTQTWSAPVYVSGGSGSGGITISGLGNILTVTGSIDGTSFTANPTTAAKVSGSGVDAFNFVTTTVVNPGDVPNDGQGNVASEVFTFVGDDIGDVVIGGFNANAIRGGTTANNVDYLDFSQFTGVNSLTDLVFYTELTPSIPTALGADVGYFNDVIIDFVNQEFGSIRLVGLGEYANWQTALESSIIFA